MQVTLPAYGNAMRSVETRTDSQLLLCDESDVQYFVETYGDVDVVLDEKVNVYRVPAFSGARELYIQNKIKECEKYGCE